MVLALTYVAGSFITLLVLTCIYVIEDIKGKRVFLLSFRTKLDAFLALLLVKIEKFMYSFTNGFMRLMLHYGAHSILKRVLAVIRKLEVKVEDLVRRNRSIAKDIRSSLRPKNHLDAIAEHKEEVALTEKEKEALLTH
jgi:hypothetical protein